MKPFKDLDEQINILKSRGLNFSDVDKAKKYLLTNNYYNVINGYSKFFTTRRNHSIYISTTDFDEIVAVHLFDKELKNVVLKAFIEAEKHFKSVVAYRFSEKYKSPYSYLNTNCYKRTSNFKEMAKISKLIGILSNIVNSNVNKKDMNSIKHHYKNHGEIPFWVLCNDMTFGQIITFYTYLDSSLQDDIARDMSTFLQSNIQNITSKTTNQVISASTLLKVLNNTNEFRNIAAHNNLIFKHRCWKSLSSQRWLPADHVSCNRQGLYYVFCYLQCLLSSSQYAILHNSIRKRVTTLKKNLHSIPISKVLQTLDFPTDWDNTSIIPLPNTPQAIKKRSIDSVKNINRPLSERLRFKSK
ncbi:Abi family protein [Streptococcus gallolyticus]|uniref:Abi family protein n=1 Tax=Streptococcus hepaticus TaxID=3349163 RepID=UPI001C98A6BE|nr:Abi family protein [Streptococcus gallolyticus]MBY5040417.1 Abi family protein [Streptococcus gallolyticus]